MEVLECPTAIALISPGTLCLFGRLLLQVPEPHLRVLLEPCLLRFLPSAEPRVVILLRPVADNRWSEN